MRTAGLRAWAPRLGVELELGRQVRAPESKQQARRALLLVPSGVTSRAARAKASPTASYPTVLVPPPSGRVPPPATALPVVATTTMSGPSRPTALTTTPDGASLMTPLRLRATTTRTTLDASVPTMTSGLRTTTDTTPVRVMPTAVPLPRSHGARAPATARVVTALPPPRPTAKTTGASPVPTGTPGAAIRTTLRT